MNDKDTITIKKDELIKYLRQNINLRRNHYNENTYNWSCGYYRCFSDVIELIMKYKEGV